MHNHDNIKEKADMIRNSLENEETTTKLANLFKVFGDSTRTRIMNALLSGELCVCEIAEVLQMTISAISHQLRTLKDANLVKGIKKGKEVFYSISDNHVVQILECGLSHVNE